jgi:hypothetical protein
VTYTGGGASNGNAIDAESSASFPTIAAKNLGNSVAIYAECTLGDFAGVYAYTLGSTQGAVLATNGASGKGIWARSATGNAVYADQSGSNPSADVIYAISPSGTNSAVFGQNISSGPGVYGYNNGSGYGVRARSVSGSAIRAEAASDNNGVYASNTDTSGNAATISAQSRDYANGLAYWGGGNVQITGKYYVSSTCVAGCSSDQRLKKNIEPLTGALNQLLQLKGVTFEWKNPEEHGNQTGVQTGFIAQQVEKVFPQWVDEDSKGVKRIVLNPTQLEALEVEGIRALKAENDDLRERVKSLEAGRRPMISGMGEGGIGVGMLAIAAALFFKGRKQRSVQA